MNDEGTNMIDDDVANELRGIDPWRLAEIEACRRYGAEHVTEHPLGQACPCGQTRSGYYIAAILDARGRRMVRAICANCARSLNAGRPSDHPAAPLIRSAACPTCGGHGCSSCSRQCEKPGCGSYEHVELHHWAPQHSFADADEWPTSYLCRPHHAEWHRVMGAGPGRAADAA